MVFKKIRIRGFVPRTKRSFQWIFQVILKAFFSFYQDLGSRVYRRHQKYKDKKEAFKLFKFLQCTLQNIPSFEVQSPGSVFFFKSGSSTLLINLINSENYHFSWTFPLYNFAHWRCAWGLGIHPILIRVFNAWFRWWFFFLSNRVGIRRKTGIVDPLNFFSDPDPTFT